MVALTVVQFSQFDQAINESIDTYVGIMEAEASKFV